MSRVCMQRVIGILLGDLHKGTVDVSNSFAGGYCSTCGSRHALPVRTA